MRELEKRSLCGDADRCCCPDKVQYALDLEAAVSALETRLDEERICETKVSHTVQTIRDFHDADCVLAIAINPQSLTLRCVDKVYRDGFISSIVETLIVPEPEMIREMMHIKSFTVLDIQTLSRNRADVYRNLALAGFHRMLIAPYGLPHHGLLAVCNPRKYAAHSSFLCLTSYIIDAELAAQKNSVQTKHVVSPERTFMENEVYVKLLDGFELHTKTGVATEQSIGRKQGTLFLVLLLLQKGQLLSTQSLLNSMWDDLDALDAPERALKNLSYNVRKKIEHLFPEKDFLEIHKAGYAVNRRYTVTTDFDRFVLRVREADDIPHLEAKLERYVEALDTFHGVVLPRHDSRIIARISAQYDRKRADIQNLSLSLMYLLKQFERMSDFIDQASVARGWDKDLHYWDIKAKMGMQLFGEAKEIFLANKEKFSSFQRNELDEFS